MEEVVIIDDFLSEESAKLHRQTAINAKYIDWPGPDGQVYKRICIFESPDLVSAIEDVCGPVEMLGMAFRLNYEGELPNAAIHSDIGWGTHALVLYLNDTQDDLGGTAFWKHKETGEDRLEPKDYELLEKVQNSWDFEDFWETTKYVPMKWNRATIYESKLFHSRYPFDAFGTTPEDGRLIVAAFFTPIVKIEKEEPKMTPTKRYNETESSYQARLRAHRLGQDDSSSNLLTNILAAEVISTVFDSAISSFDTGSSSSDSFSGGGGDFGGGGSSGDF